LNNNQEKIYIVCPKKLYTGGTELLHQLADQLNNINQDTYIYYLLDKNNNTVNIDYFKSYNIKCADTIEDSEANILIVPEVYTYLLKKFKNIRKMIWWLSVDNYFYQHNIKNKIKKLLDYHYPIEIQKLSEMNIYHLAQSYYSIDFLKKHNITNTAYLSDYLNMDFILNRKTEKIKRDIVAYNPRKGFEFTKKIIDSSDGITYCPIANMSRDQVVDLLKSAKVYIDFGSHPGKDRIPREAAICGCCVITNRQGSANYYEDVPILDDYKFDDTQENVPQIIAIIQNCFDNYSREIEKFREYRNIILEEKANFISDVNQIFGIIACK
jgi:hypothetical protein